MALCGLVLTWLGAGRRLLARMPDASRNSPWRDADLEQVYRTAPLGLAMLDRELRYVLINEHLARINGLPVVAHIGKTVAEVLPGLAEKVEASCRQVLESGQAVTGQEMSGATGREPQRVHHWRQNIYPLLDESGEVVGLNVIVEEITEHKRLDAALRASEEQERRRAGELAALMEVAPAAIWIARDSACSFMSCNPEAERMLRGGPGQNMSATGTSDTVAARTFIEYMHGRPAAPHELPLQVAAATGQEVRGAELSLTFKDGEVRHIIGNASPLRDGEGHITGAVGVFLDITAQKNAEQALLDAARRKDEFVAMLGHELRNPLAPLQTGADILVHLESVDPALHSIAQAMARQVQHLVRLVDSLLEGSRITSGKITLKSEILDGVALLGASVDDHRQVAESAGVALASCLAPDPAWVLGDPVRLAQVFNNLLDNAIKYTPTGGNVRVTAVQEDDKLLVQVRDSGVGIDPSFLPHVFDVFAQSDHGSSRGGLGLGLPIARKMVELHGGTINVSSEGRGAGTLVELALPLAAPGGPKPASIEAPLPVRRVLVVDDNRDALDSMRMLLMLHGCQVRTAEDGRSACEMAREFAADIALLDIRLPDTDGYALLRELKTIPGMEKTVFIAVTGFGQEHDLARSLSSGFAFHLVKPVDYASLVRAFAASEEPVAP